MPPLPSQAPVYGAPEPAAPVPPAYAPSGEVPPASQWVRPYPEGQWVYTADYGWIWVPAGSVTTAVEGVPYAYMYTASFGWTWYLSPWGWGPYHYGGWVLHPHGWHGRWGSPPHPPVHAGHHHR